MSTTNIVLCGVGGQGTVLASKLIASAAMNKGLQVRSAETIGMAQRGGSVFSFVRVGDDINSPMIPTGEADIIIGFEPAETVRMLPNLKKGGIVITSDRPVIPVTAALKASNYNGEEMTNYLKSVDSISRLILVDTDKAISDIGNPKVANMVLLGAAARTGILGSITHDDIVEAMKKRVKPQFYDMNIKALAYVEV